MSRPSSPFPSTRERASSTSSSPSSSSFLSFSSSSSTSSSDSPPLTPTLTRAPLPLPSKREYLLAQIRQKDAIIESLLKQVRARVPLPRCSPTDTHPTAQLHNPYLATPLSIAAYRMATPASDNHRQNVIAWLDRLQSSSTVRDSTVGAGLAAGLSSTPSAGAYRLREHRDADDDSDIAEGAGGAHDEEQPKSASTLVDPDAYPDAHAHAERDVGAGADPDAEEDEAETYAGLPDAAVPLGLLAKLSISNSMEKVRERERGKGRGGAQGGAGNRAGGAQGGAGGKESHPPAKRYRLTDKIKGLIWQLVCLSNECCRIENEKKCVECGREMRVVWRADAILFCSQLENNNQVVSDQGVRKGLYQKVRAADITSSLVSHGAT